MTNRKTEHRNSLKEMAELLVRIRYALELLPVADERKIKAVKRWTSSLLSGDYRGIPGSMKIATSITSDLQGFTLHISDEPEEFIRGLGDYFKDAGVSHKEMNMVAELGEVIQPGRLEGWFGILGDHTNAGWSFPVDIPCCEIFPLLNPSRPLELLEKWLLKHDVQRFRHAGRHIKQNGP